VPLGLRSRVPRAGRFDLVVVGLGSAGLTAVSFASALGLRVAAVERDRVGGDCLWTGCVPSKALIAAARAAHAMRHADRFGLRAVEPQVDPDAVWARVRAVQDEIAATDDSPERLLALGVTIVHGAARVTGPHRVRVDDRELRARRILLCTGSHPSLPEVAGLREAGVQTSETLWALERPPRSIVALGGGPLNVELAQAFTRLGVPTTIVEQGPRLMAAEEPELVAVLDRRLRADGVRIEVGVEVERVERRGDERVVHGRVAGEPRAWHGEAVLAGVGRTPAVAGLGLEALGIEVTGEGIAVDRRERTAVRSIFAVGDVTGGLRYTHAAGFDAARAVRAMFFPGTTRRAGVTPWCTFTDPELGHAGLTVAQARAEHGDDAVTVHRHDLAHSDRARTDDTTTGAIALVTARRRLVGAHVLAPGAGEIVNELALAIERGLKLDELGGVVHVYPTIGLAIQQLAGAAALGRARRLGWLARRRP
jgi:pyruvate/2-oxoglutarate dehydrogenase complex dihydrolipoamide dehydrogenase (E3) component